MTTLQRAMEEVQALRDHKIFDTKSMNSLSATCRDLHSSSRRSSVYRDAFEHLWHDPMLMRTKVCPSVANPDLDFKTLIYGQHVGSARRLGFLENVTQKDLDAEKAYLQVAGCDVTRHPTLDEARQRPVFKIGTPPKQRSFAWPKMARDTAQRLTKGVLVVAVPTAAIGGIVASLFFLNSIAPAAVVVLILLAAALRYRAR